MDGGSRLKPLRQLSHQNVVAAIKLQAVFRGFLTRKRLWRYGGVLMVSRTVKIQRVWRGCVGRRLFRRLFVTHLHNCANKLIALYLRWKARRFRRILRAEVVNRAVVRLQSLYRGRQARKSYAQMLFEHRTRKAKIIQRVARGYLGRRRTRCIKRRMKRNYETMKTMRTQNITLLYEKRNNSNKSQPPSPTKHSAEVEPSDLSQSVKFSRMTSWNLFREALWQQFSSERFDQSFAASIQLFREHAAFPLNQYIMQFVLLTSWSSFGSARLVREDLLEEALGIACNNEMDSSVLTLRDRNTANPALPYPSRIDTAAVYSNVLAKNSSEQIDIVSMFLGGVLNEVEFMTFKAAIMLRGRAAKVLMMMAVCCSLRNDPTSTFLIRQNKNAEESRLRSNSLNRELLNNLKRANFLAYEARRKALPDESESIHLMLDVIHHIYGQPHVLLGSKRLILMEGSFLKLEPAVTSIDCYNAVSVEIQLIQTGNLVMIRGLAPCYLNQDKSLGSEVSDLEIRPMVLLSKEAELFLHWAKERAESQEMKQQNRHGSLRRRSLKSNEDMLLCDFLFPVVRMLSTTSKFGPSPMNPSLRHVRLAIPHLEYMRRERNVGRSEAMAVRFIQKVFRGFVGRSRYRRLVARAAERGRQVNSLKQRRNDLTALRRHRYLVISKIQAAARGIILRKYMRKLKRAAVMVQCRVRIMIAKRILSEEKRRRMFGAEVHMMLRKVAVVGGLEMCVSIYRSGSNYRIVGQDVSRNAVYECFAYTEEIVRLLEQHNRDHEGETVTERNNRIKLWQHARVTEYLLSQLRLAKRITPLTKELGGKKVDTPLELVLLPSAQYEVKTLHENRNLMRYLKQEKAAVIRYEKFLQKRADEESLKKSQPAAKYHGERRKAVAEIKFAPKKYG